MLDTLKLSLSDYEISGDANLTVQPPTFNPATKELGGYYPLWRTGSTHVVGSKAYHNADDFYVTVMPFNASEPQSIGCHVSFSVAKVANGSNLEPADFKTTEQALETIERELRSIGIKTNIVTATLSRLDSCKNVVTSEPFAAYAPVLARLEGKRVAKTDYGTTFLWRNTLQQVCVYDKREEMKRNKRSLLRVPANVVRFEHRLTKARKIRDTLGFNTAGDLLIGFDQVKRGYVTAMENQLFHYSPSELEIRTVQDFVTDLMVLKRSGVRNYVAAFVLIKGLESLTADKEAFLAAVEQVSDNRMTLCRSKKMLREAGMDALSLQRESTSKRTLGDLYRELEREVLSR